jgi:hypothetical protein
MSIDELYRTDELRRGMRLPAMYPWLRGLAELYRLLAYLVGILAVVGVIAGCVMLPGESKGAGLALLLTSLLGGAFQFVTFLGLADAAEALIETVETVRNVVVDVRKLSKDGGAPG